ncbi:hypothetical protein D9M70_629530 [compost metagenome]
MVTSGSKCHASETSIGQTWTLGIAIAESVAIQARPTATLAALPLMTKPGVGSARTKARQPGAVQRTGLDTGRCHGRKQPVVNSGLAG